MSYQNVCQDGIHFENEFTMNQDDFVIKLSKSTCSSLPTRLAVSQDVLYCQAYHAAAYAFFKAKQNSPSINVHLKVNEGWC